MPNTKRRRRTTLRRLCRLLAFIACILPLASSFMRSQTSSKNSKGTINHGA